MKIFAYLLSFHITTAQGKIHGNICAGKDVAARVKSYLSTCI